MKIEVFGSGCPKCRATKKIIKQVIDELAIDAEINEITDLKEIIDRGVVLTPTVMINGEAKIIGRVPSPKEVKKLLQKLEQP